MRKALTIGTVLLGFVLMVIGFLAAAPWGSSSVSDSNPVITGAPILFLLGIVSIVAAAVLYEVLPDKRR
jgi:uncharacterized BrkB/YihY/UPF0761 family membrane protein